jgi:gamma-glutamyltranspeptidase/glutathione hydrolase
MNTTQYKAKNALLGLFAKAFALTTFSTLSTITIAEQASDKFEPEAASESVMSNEKYALASEFMLVTAHPAATKIGYDILKNGGNAVDAMVAVQVALGLVEPQSSGLGGGAFTLYWDAALSKLTSYDGRETAPQQADESLFLDEKGQALGFFEAVVGGRSVGTPGTVKLLWEMHKQYGSVPWDRLLEPTRALAEKGFEVGPRLSAALKRDRERLKTDSEAFNYFFPNGQAVQPGVKLVNKDYAQTLSLLMKQGGDYFYQEPFAQAIVDKVSNAANPGLLSLQDFKRYNIVERAPVCNVFLGYEVCGMGPPSSGAYAVNQILMQLSNTNFLELAPESTQAWHYIHEMTRLAFADRGAFLADPDFSDVPTGLLDKQYVQSRAQLANPNTKSKTLEAGKPPTMRTSYVPSESFEQTSTTHFVIVDKDGNIISSTSTIENGFGARLMVHGFLLNNELTDFSFKPAGKQGPIANRVEAGKRPRSSMAPTLVMKDNKPYLAIGSPGGSRIINYVANSLIRHLAWNTALDQLFALPHQSNRFGQLDLEATQSGKVNEALLRDLEKIGYTPNIKPLNSGLHAIRITAGQLEGAADPRREGTVAGQK